ncbi:MAG: universal stress protein [Thaumarchaeota archaeon]|nr:universal stress protein [Nitrososphaerota archaeon]
MATYERILVAIDGSENSLRAAEWAVDLAKKDGASLFVISVIPAPVYSSSAQPGMPAPTLKAFFDKARTDAESVVQGVVSKAESSGIKVRGEIIENVPSVVEAVSDYAEEWKVQLIVVGTRGLTGFKKLLLGSVSGALVAHSPCSVLVVR